MDRKKASDFPPEVLELFDGYVHGHLSRRDFLDRAAGYTAGGMGAAAMLASLSPNFAYALQVPEGDPRIGTEWIEYPSPKGSGKMKGYLCKPAKGGKAAGVVVVHENRGLNPYIQDVARRVAAEGYVAFAPDGLAPVGGYPGNEEADPRINAGWPAWEEALKRNNVRYTMRMYPATQHGFHNDTTPRYDEAAAKLAWQRTLDFFELHLRG